MRIFGFLPKILTLGKIQKQFGFSLTYSYLCTRKHCHGLSLVSSGTRGKSGQHRAPHF